MKYSWYLQRIGRMTPAEIAGRIRDQSIKIRWRGRRARSGMAGRVPSLSEVPEFSTPLPPPDTHRIPAQARDALTQAADALVDSRWRIFDRVREDMHPVPDWFLDPRTGHRAPQHDYAFDIQFRDEEEVGNIKYVWELSRHHHLTLLAAAFYLSRDDRYAESINRHLTSWWKENPFLSGVHWTSGIELGLRLISWVWVRRLLHDWSGVRDLFEHNLEFRQQLYDHQQYLATFPSRGSSANNHALAEAAGQFVSCCAFPYFSESKVWRSRAADILKREIPRQTFSDGLNRELATDYHVFALELCLAAALEGEASGQSLGREVWLRVRSMTDALAAILDARGRPPRQGDEDDGIVLLLDDPKTARCASLLATGEALFEACEWWPRFSRNDVRTALWTALSERLGPIGDRPSRRPAIFPDAGMVLMRDRSGEPDEIWCRCDHGPHGFLSIAAHAHADALSIEVRHGGVDILAEPGTYCYHGETEWRAYFRSTLGHNTLELDGADQSVSGGPFMWLQHARSGLISTKGLNVGPAAEWTAFHHGYKRLTPPAVHKRKVRLEREARKLVVEDFVEGAGNHSCRLAFHLGPTVRCRLEENHALLEWDADGKRFSAVMALPEDLVWTQVRGQDNPPMGWYSPAFGTKVPSVVLVGSGTLQGNRRFTTTVQFDPDKTR